jgi:putative ATPase
MSDLFNQAQPEILVSVKRPLADLMRPTSFDFVVGQERLLGPNTTLSLMISRGSLSSFILWGPPGVGKTTIARLLSTSFEIHFEQLSAIFSGVKELRNIFDSAKIRKKNGKSTLLFVDEIHRFNKSQQDAFLPYIEDGTIVLVGATTENPSFSLNSALLSRCQVLVLDRLSVQDLEQILTNIQIKMNNTLLLSLDAKNALIDLADGDARSLINMIEQIFSWNLDTQLDRESLTERLSKRMPNFNRTGEEHFNLISALHKSIRGSDPDAALYWLSRMMDSGEDPNYLFRRLTRIALEDIGLADENAKRMCLESWNVYERLGSPEGDLALAEVTIYLALAVKSNAVYTAFKNSNSAAIDNGSQSPPKHILNAPTMLMKEQGYGEGYKYDHDYENSFSGQDYFPNLIKDREYYNPSDQGAEKDLRAKLEYFKSLRKSREC